MSFLFKIFMGWQHFWVGKNYFEYKRFKKKKRKKKRKAYGIYFQKKKFRFKNPMTLKKKKFILKLYEFKIFLLSYFWKEISNLVKEKFFFFFFLRKDPHFQIKKKREKIYIFFRKNIFKGKKIYFFKNILKNKKEGWREDF